MSIETVKIELTVSPTFWDKAPIAKIWMNTDVLHTGELREPKTLTWEGQLIEGEHAIKIAYYGKDGRTQTIVENDVIVKDQLLNIDSLIIDDIAVDDVLWLNSEYVSEDGRKIDKIINLGVNGTWTFKFSSPVYIWLLEHLS